MLRLGRPGLRLEHALHRLRHPRHSQRRSILVLILDPVAYELAPLLLSDKALNLRRRIARRLVMLIWGQGECSYIGQKIILETSEAGEKRLFEGFKHYSPLGPENANHTPRMTK